MIALGSKRWTSSNPTINLTFSYEKQRSGADMQYRAQVTVSTVNGSRYFGYPIYLKLTIGGELRETTTLKKASPSQWSSAITYTSPWYTVSGKTTGTTPISFNVYSGLGSSRTATYSYDMEVDPAASGISASNGTLGTTLKLNLTRYNSSFTDTITYKCGTATGTITSGSTAASVNWTTSNGNTLQLAAQETSDQSVSVVFTVTTYSGSTLVGTSSTTVNMVIPDTVKPSVTLSVEDAAGYLSTYGAYVQGYSKLKITATPTLAYGSPIKTYAITADGSSYSTSPVTTGAIKGKGTLSITATVTDNRTRPSEPKSKDITVLEYANPVVNLAAYRCDSSGTTDPEGAYMMIVVTSTISSLNNKNKATYEVVYPGGKFTGSGTSFTSGVLPCDVSTTHTIEAKITDNLSYTPKTVTIPIAYTLIDYYHTGKGISFGKVGTREGFDCAMPAYFSGATSVSGALNASGTSVFSGDATFSKDIKIGDSKIADFVVERGTSGIWAYEKYSSGVAKCWGMKQYDSASFDSSFGALHYHNCGKIAYPFSFTDYPVVMLSQQSASARVASVVMDSVDNQKHETGTIYLYSSGNVATTAYVSLFVLGTWK